MEALVDIGEPLIIAGVFVLVLSIFGARAQKRVRRSTEGGRAVISGPIPGVFSDGKWVNKQLLVGLCLLVVGLTLVLLGANLGSGAA